MNQDPYRYFRVEAAELLENLTRGALVLERDAAEQGTVAGLLRLAHTLKGASQVVKQPQIAQAANTVEDILSPYREGGEAVPKDRTREMLRVLDQAGAWLTALNSPAPPETPPPAAVPAELLETLRVEVEEVEGLLGSLSEADVALGAVHREAAALAQSRQLAQLILRQAGRPAATVGEGRIHAFAGELLGSLGGLERRLLAAVEQTERELAQARERVHRLLLLPAEAIFPALARAVRDAAGALGNRPVEVRTTGGEIRLDTQVLVVLRDALLHLVRNAVAHGIETPEVRAARGKPPRGLVEIQVRRAGNRLTCVCRDDGGGIDVAAIRWAAVKQGVIPPGGAETLGLRQAIDLILRGGVSTTAAVTGISGRGIGLDVVRDAVARLKGEIAIETAPGRGTSVEIRVPVSLASVPALLVESGGEVAALPLESVREVVRDFEIVLSEAGQSIAYRGRAIPFLALSDALRRKPARGERGSAAAVVVASAPATAAVGVSRLLGIRTLLQRALPAMAAAQPAIAGGSLDSEGNPLLILDAAALVEAVRSAVRRVPETWVAPAPILVVDDSLTTRMVEQSLLEAAGHIVETATSGKEALEKARAGRYSLFVVDIEMPGMDGFEFIARVREDPRLREIPSILVTSRNSVEDRRRGDQAGARAYVCKNEFDQAYLLETIRRLVE